MRRKYSIKFALCVLGLSPVIGFAVDPATQPAVPVAAVGDMQPATPDTTLPGDATKPRRPYADGSAGRRPLQRPVTITEDDKTHAMDFMRVHSTNRFAAIDKLQEGKNKTRAKELAAQNYLNWTQVQKEDPDLYNVILDRVKVEDDIFGLLNEAQNDTPEKIEATHLKLKEKVVKLVAIGLDERRLRLKQLQKTLDEQQKRLADDSANPAALVDERWKNILNEEKMLVPNSGNNGPGGQRGRNGPRTPGDSRPGDSRPPGQ